MTRSPHLLRRAIVVLVALTWTNSALAATQFVTQTVTSTGNVGQFATTTFGAQGEPLVGYWDGARQDMRLATKTGGLWTLETAESTSVLGLYTSLAVSAAGDPSISYYDATAGDLKLARRSGTGWTLETVDTVGNVGLYTSLKLDASGNPHVSYYDQTLGNLKYASKSGGVWTLETVDAAGDVGSYTSLALDAGGNPSISYWDATNGDLKLARKSGGAWTLETVDAAGTVGEFSSLALDGSGNPHVSYFDRTKGRLKLGVRTGGVWGLQTVPDTVNTVGQYTSLALDAVGDARISYFDVTNADLKFARYFRQTTPADTAYWIISQVDGAGDVGRFSSLTMDAATDLGLIAYYDASNQNLKLAINTTVSTWRDTVLDAPGNIGQFPSINLKGGIIRVSYWDTSREDLKMVTVGNPAPIETVDDGGNVGQFASLAVDPQGDPFLSYWDDSYGVSNLRMASRVGGVWTSELVDSAGSVGQYTSIALDAQGDPRISYYDVTHGDLKYAFRSGAQWFFETVDVVGDVGRFTSLAIDAQGNAHISYYDATNGDLKYASRGAGGGWTTEIADGVGDVGQYAALALDAQSEPRVSYFDATNGDLKYASRSGGTWTLETVDAAGNVGQHTSIALARGPSPYRSTDAVGDPRISYYDVTKKDLRFASRTAGHWALETLDSDGDFGQYTSLALDPQGNARVAYYDATNGDLKYAIQHYPDIALWAYPGGFRSGGARADSIVSRPRTITLRWMRDPLMESRADFGGYRIYRVFYSPDTSRFELIRRFSVNASDSLFMWHFRSIDETTALPQRIATFVDPDSDGTFVKRCRRDSLGKCYSPGDSIIVLLAPPGPHDGFRTWYAITYEARNVSSNDYIDMLLDDAIACPDSDRATCPNLNHKARNMTGPIEPTIGPSTNLQKVAVVPNPFRASEVWDIAAAHEVHFINLPPQAKIRIYTIAGDLVAELEHKDNVRDFERWDLKNGRGRDVSSGIYIYRVEAANFFAQDRFVVIR